MFPVWKKIIHDSPWIHRQERPPFASQQLVTLGQLIRWEVTQLREYHMTHSEFFFCVDSSNQDTVGWHADMMNRWCFLIGHNVCLSVCLPVCWSARLQNVTSDCLSVCNATEYYLRLSLCLSFSGCEEISESSPHGLERSLVWEEREKRRGGEEDNRWKQEDEKI